MASSNETIGWNPFPNDESHVHSLTSSPSDLSISSLNSVSPGVLCDRFMEASEYRVEELPNYTYDPDFNGKEYGIRLRCMCGRRLARRVVSSGSNTGRRFLGCPRKIMVCKFVKWVDPQWDERAARTISSLSDSNIALKTSLDSLHQSLVSLKEQKMHEDSEMREMLAKERNKVVKIKLNVKIFMVAMFASLAIMYGLVYCGYW